MNDFYLIWNEWSIPTNMSRNAYQMNVKPEYMYNLVLKNSMPKGGGGPNKLKVLNKKKYFFHYEQIMFTSFRYIFDRLEYKSVFKIVNVPL